MLEIIDQIDFPVESESNEFVSIKDKNDFEWLLAAKDDGIYFLYLGDPYFKESNFEILTERGYQLVENTGCFFVEENSFDCYYEYRELITQNYTDIIWEELSETIFKQ